MADLRSVLTAHYRKHGDLTPEIVVDEARPKGAPLHDRFEWDNKIAGEKYRLVQAQQLIRSVQIEFIDTRSGERKFVRGFHSRREAGQAANGYQPTEEIVQDDVSLRLLLKQCEREIADLKRKYGHLEGFADMMRQAIA